MMSGAEVVAMLTVGDGGGGGGGFEEGGARAVGRNGEGAASERDDSPVRAERSKSRGGKYFCTKVSQATTI